MLHLIVIAFIAFVAGGFFGYKDGAKAYADIVAEVKKIEAEGVSDVKAILARINKAL